MSQVDYIHFFSNIIWSIILFIIIYILVAVYYVQYFYKIFRLRNIIFIKILYLLILQYHIICLFLNNFVNIFEKNINKIIKIINILIKLKNAKSKNICL